MMIEMSQLHPIKMAFASAAGNYCDHEVIYELEQRANEVWRDVLQNKLEEQVNISSLVGNDTSTIPVGNVLILLKDIYYPTKRAIV